MLKSFLYKELQEHKYQKELVVLLSKMAFGAAEGQSLDLHVLLGFQNNSQLSIIHKIYATAIFIYRLCS